MTGFALDLRCWDCNNISSIFSHESMSIHEIRAKKCESPDCKSERHTVMKCVAYIENKS